MLSDEAFEVMKYIMKFNYQNIYLIDRIEVHTNYVLGWMSKGD